MASSAREAHAGSFRARTTELTMPTPDSIGVIDSASRRERPVLDHRAGCDSRLSEIKSSNQEKPRVCRVGVGIK